MSLIPLVAMVRKDLQLFFSDRRSVIVSFVVPIAIATFFGSMFRADSTDRARISVAVVDNDASSLSKAVVSGLQRDGMLRVSTLPEQDAREAVHAGQLSLGVVIPNDFGETIGRAMFEHGERPNVALVYDPTRSMELAVVRGLLTEHVMQAVGQDAASRLPAFLASMGQIRTPYEVREEAMTSPYAAYNGYAHSFGGMAIQFLLFAMSNLGVEMLLERQRGLWRRLRSAPVSRLTLLAGKAASGALISLLILLVCFAFAIAVFHVRIEGSVVGFLGVCVACSIMASTFGLLVAALGNSPATARGFTMLAVLMMVMLGGAWVPTFVFPAWVQRITVVVPVRWAVDGLDATTWRGIGLSGVLEPIGVLLAFAAFFGVVALSRFRWEEAL